MRDCTVAARLKGNELFRCSSICRITPRETFSARSSTISKPFSSPARHHIHRADVAHDGYDSQLALSRCTRNRNGWRRPILPLPINRPPNRLSGDRECFLARSFLAATGTLPFAASVASGQDSARKKIAIIATVWTYQSHAQHMGDRFLVGYPRGGKWHKPPIDVVSLYVDQRPDGDRHFKRAAEHGFTVYKTIAEAFRRGGDKLAVDGVVIIGEHGNYPRNTKVRSSIHGTSFSNKSLRYSTEMDVSFLSTTTNTCPTVPKKPSGWSQNRSG